MLKHIAYFIKYHTPYYFITPVKDIKHSCFENCEVEVLDFDKVKDTFLNDLKINDSCKLCSVDGVFFDNRNNSVCVFDMKRFNPLYELTAEEYIKPELKNLSKKVVDTLYLFCAILGYYNIDKSNYYTLLHPSQLRIKPYLVVNVKSSQDIEILRLAFLNDLKISLSRRIEENIQMINCQEFEDAFSYSIKKK